MTCIKTGARVHFLDYGYVVPADIFRVGGAIVVRTPKLADEAFPKYDGTNATHKVASSIVGEEFWRADLGVFVVPAHNFSEIAK